ncbi:MAG: hypothetical protein EPO24_00905 [Bacteroidetes bacterium]|nr:MAG: hypothetical protein EPO24_00905 [Bacteroidota bacterium]
MKPLTSVDSIKDPYTKRILSNTLGKDAFKLYSATPTRLQRAVKGLTVKQCATPPAKGKWSIAQIVAHLCDAEIVGGWRLRMIIAQSGTAIQAYDEKKWAAAFRYEKINWKHSLELFATLRKSNVSILESITKAQWNHFGMHEERGKESVERIVQMYAGHDVNHVKQVESIVKNFK